jgi:hypothetical protein
MLPPSIHPSGELVELRMDGEIAQADKIEHSVENMPLAAFC